MYVKRFESVDGLHTYTFTDTVQNFRTNFGNLVPRTTRMPGADGGFRLDGDGKPASEIGNIQFAFFLVSATREGMETLRDGAKAMQGWGLGRLFIQPSDPALAERWAWCYVNSVDIPETPSEHTDLFQRVQCSFQTTDPYWYTAGNMTLWDETEWDLGEWTSDNTVTVTTASVDTTQTNGGTAVTYPIISLAASGECVNPRLQRIVSAAVIDEINYNGVLDAGDILEINCRAKKAYLNGDDAWAQISITHPDWLRLLPGANTVRIMGDDVLACEVTIGFFDRWF